MRTPRGSVQTNWFIPFQRWRKPSARLDHASLDVFSCETHSLVPFRRCDRFATTRTLDWTLKPTGLLRRQMYGSTRALTPRRNAELFKVASCRMVKTHTSAATNHLRFDDLEELHDGDGWVHQEHVIEDALVQWAGNIKNMSLKTPWCILQALTAVSKMERFEHCWRYLSDKTGQPLHCVIH